MRVWGCAVRLPARGLLPVSRHIGCGKIGDGICRTLNMTFFKLKSKQPSTCPFMHGSVYDMGCPGK